MAQEMDDLEFLLPSELLTEDELLTDFGGGFGNSDIFSPDLRSPVESVTGSLEAGSDEDDPVAELTRTLTRSGFRDSSLSCDCIANGLKLSGSPKSTLCGFKPGSRGTPTSHTRVRSPLEVISALSRDVLYAAAEEVARVRMAEETAAFYPNELFTPVPKPGPVAVRHPQHDPSTNFYPIQPQTQAQLSYHHLQAAKVQQMKQNQLMMVMMKNGAIGQGNMEYRLRGVRRDVGGDPAYGLSMFPRPVLQQSQQRTGTAMKAVFLGETGPKKERVGTGVFMPRRFSPNLSENQKKQGFSLNPNLDFIDAQIMPEGTGNFSLDHDAVLKQRYNLMAPYQGRSIRPQPAGNQEFRLPRDWTY